MKYFISVHSSVGIRRMLPVNNGFGLTLSFNIEYIYNGVSEF